MIIFISGSINSGKSTTARLLAKRLPRSAHIEVDTLRHMISWMPIDEAVSINLLNTVSVAKNFAKQDIDVVVDYPLSKHNHSFLMESLVGTKTPVYFFTLAPSREVALKNRGKRKLSNPERARITHHYDIGITTPDFGEIIDNSSKTPTDVVGEILAKIQS